MIFMLCNVRRDWLRRHDCAGLGLGPAAEGAPFVASLLASTLVVEGSARLGMKANGLLGGRAQRHSVVYWLDGECTFIRD